MCEKMVGLYKVICLEFMKRAKVSAEEFWESNKAELLELTTRVFGKLFPGIVITIDTDHLEIGNTLVIEAADDIVPLSIRKEECNGWRLGIYQTIPGRDIEPDYVDVSSVSENLSTLGIVQDAAEEWFLHGCLIPFVNSIGDEQLAADIAWEKEHAAEIEAAIHTT